MDKDSKQQMAIDIYRQKGVTVGTNAYSSLFMPVACCIYLGVSEPSKEEIQAIEPAKLYSSDQAAHFLNVTKETVKKYCKTPGNQGLKGKQTGPKRVWFVWGKEIIRKRKEWGLD